MEYCVRDIYSTQAPNALNDYAFYSKYSYYTTFCKRKLRNILFLISRSYQLIRSSQGVKLSTVEPGYNDIVLCDTSSITSDVQWYQLIIPYC
jgi:hypothetical protein